MPKGIKGFQRGMLNPMWVGAKISYNGIHDWVRRYLPKPAKCGQCKKLPPFDLANISQLYKRDLSDWKWVCRQCHMLEDGRIKRLILRNKLVTRKTIRFSENPKMIKLFREIASTRKRNSNGQFI